MAAGTRSTKAHRRTVGSLAAMACAAALLTGCGSGAINGPDAGGNGQGATAANGDRGGGKDSGGRGHHYGFGLPEGPTSGVPDDKKVYDRIRKGDCGGAAAHLNQSRAKLTDPALLEIGIALCRGRTGTARDGLRAYSPGFGREDQTTWFLCELYRAAMSVVHQRPRSAYGTCPAPPDIPTSGPSDSSTPDETETPDQTVTPSVSESPLVPSPVPDGQASPEAGG